MLEWIVWDSLEFEKTSCASGYSFLDPCAFYARAYYAPFWCDMCSSSNNNTASCPFYARYPQLDSFLPLAQCTGFEAGKPFGLVPKFDMDATYCD